MPQPNQGSPAPSAPMPEPITTKNGAMNSDAIKTGIHTTGIKGK